MTLDRDPSDVFYDKWKDTEDRLAAAEAALADYKDVSGEQYDYDTLLFKYGEKARDLRECQGYARDLRARAEAAEARAVAAEAERDEAWRVSEYRRTAAKKHMNALDAGQDAPEGKQIVRILGTSSRMTGSGTNYITTYTVVVTDAEKVKPCPDVNCAMPDGHPGKHYDTRDGAAW